MDVTPTHLDSRLLDMSDDWTYYRFVSLELELQVRLPRANEQTLGCLYSPLCLAYVPVIAGTAGVWDKNVIWTGSVYKHGTPYSVLRVSVPRRELLGETSYNWLQIATDSGTGGPDIQGRIYGGWSVQDADSSGAVQLTVSYEVELRGTQDPAVSFQRRLQREQRNGALASVWPALRTSEKPSIGAPQDSSETVAAVPCLACRQHHEGLSVDRAALCERHNPSVAEGKSSDQVCGGHWDIMEGP